MAADRPRHVRCRRPAHAARAGAVRAAVPGKDPRGPGRPGWEGSVREGRRGAERGQPAFCSPHGGRAAPGGTADLPGPGGGACPAVRADLASLCPASVPAASRRCQGSRACARAAEFEPGTRRPSSFPAFAPSRVTPPGASRACSLPQPVRRAVADLARASPPGRSGLAGVGGWLGVGSGEDEQPRGVT